MKNENYVGYYDILKKPIVDMLKEYRASFIEMRGYDMQPRDFDNWVAGVFTGLTLDKSELVGELPIEEQMANLKRVIDAVVDSPVAKDMGVTGTLKEVMRAVDNSKTN